jgi:hypothetical protein
MPAAKQNANSVAVECCGVYDSEGELEDKSKATINVNDHKCNIAEKILRTTLASFLTWRVKK